jgi:GAF domain-containing protein
LERRVVHIPDVSQDLEYSYEGLKIFDYRTMLGVPLLREEALIGIFVVARTRVQPFTDKEIEIATRFADQAVIAIENARLIEQLRDRQAELRVTFDNMGDGVAMFGADTRLVAWNRNFQTILDLADEVVAQRPTYVDFVRLLAKRGEFGTDDIEGELSRRLQDTDRELRLERSRPDGQVIEVRRTQTLPRGSTPSRRSARRTMPPRSRCVICVSRRIVWCRPRSSLRSASSPLESLTRSRTR